MGLVACCCCCLLLALIARRASSTLVSNNLINRLNYYVLQLGDPYPYPYPYPRLGQIPDWNGESAAKDFEVLCRKPEESAMIQTTAGASPSPP